jgi:hypothetical protein
MFPINNSYNFTKITKEGDVSNYKITKLELQNKYPEIGNNTHIIDIDQEFKISNIVANGQVILFKINHIRCLITKDCVLIPCICGGDIVLLLGKNISLMTETPFEFKVMETIFEYMVKYFDKQVTDLIIESNITKYMNFTGSAKPITYEQRNNLAMSWNKTLELEFRLSDIYELFEQLSEDSKENQAKFYLTEIAESAIVSDDSPTYSSFSNPIDILGPEISNKSIRSTSSSHSSSSTKYDTDMFQQMINTYSKHLEENVDQIEKQRKTFEVVNELINTQLTIRRTSLAEVNLLFSILSVAVQVSNLISSAFGMNLNSGLETSPYIFWIMCSIMVVLIFILHHIFWKIFKKI